MFSEVFTKWIIELKIVTFLATQSLVSILTNSQWIASRIGTGATIFSTTGHVIAPAWTAMVMMGNTDIGMT